MKAILFDVDDTIYDQAVRYQERYVYYGTQITVPDQMRGILERWVNPEDIVYVGDSYEKDIMGAAGAGWKTIWLERREREAPADIPEHTLIARNEEELFQLIREMS